MQQVGPDDPGGPSDDELVARTLAGDREAFGVIWDRHHRRVFGYGFRLLGHAERAEDATGETFRRALAGLARYRRASGFRSWLFAIAHNVIVDDLRTSNRIVTLDELA